MPKMLAMPDPNYPSIVTLADGTRMKRADAVKKGHKIYGVEGANDANQNAEISHAHEAWRSAVLCLPEAREREAAAAEIVSSQTKDSMSIESARAFLRGLPIEQEEEALAVATNNDPNAARRAEIAANMAAFNKGNGYRPKATTIAAPSPGNVDPTKLKRLAEIRLAAISLRMERGESALTNEHKKLSYAFSVHNQTGLPLATVFAQLGVDTTKMLSA